MPRRKSWTVLALVVAKNQDDAGDAKYLNSKADEVVQRIKAAAAKFSDDMYVAYQVVFDPEETRPEKFVAEILNPDGLDQTTHVGPFTVPISSNSPLADDLLGFYAWALPRCPADHLAIFFWGHSAGPVGLFESQLSIPVPPHPVPPTRARIRATAPIPTMSMFDIRRVLLKTRQARTREFFVLERTLDDLTDLILNAPLDDVVVDPTTGTPVKADVVLFQDCWMSTLETAFELKDAAHFIVGSQSLVPFGRPSNENECKTKPTKDPFAGVWRYDQLFDKLRHHDSNAPRASFGALVDELSSFYDDTRNIWPNPSVPFTLLDLGTINSGTHGAFATTAFNKLVSAIMRLMPGSNRSAKKLRGAFIEKASLAVAYKKVCRARRRGPRREVAAGSIALIDVKMLCSQLKADPRLTPDELDAITALIDSELVVTCKESIYRPTLPPHDLAQTFEITRPDDSDNTPQLLNHGMGFNGVSALYYPTPARSKIWGNSDRCIADAVSLDRGFYDDLALAKETDWGKLALEQIPTL